MKIIRLKEEFVSQAISIDSEFLEKHTRGYMYIKVSVEYVDYLIPFRSTVSHRYCYTFSNNNLKDKYIDFTKAIPLVNQNIIDRSIMVEKAYFDLYEENIRRVANLFSKYLLNDHKNSLYSVDHERIILLQKQFKN